MKKNCSENRKLSIILKSIVIIAVIYGCTTISEGFRTLTKFTTFSNVGIGVAAMIVLIDEIRIDKGHTVKHLQGKYIFKFMMTLSIAITFILFLAILAPTSAKGFIGAYLNNNCGSLRFISFRRLRLFLISSYMIDIISQNMFMFCSE